MSFKSIDRKTSFLFPPSVEEWLPETHLARFVVDIVSRLNLSPLAGGYASRGEEAYPPAMMVALLFYGYATGSFSSRVLERKTYDSVAFRYICANTHPDHSTISTFRQRFLEYLKPLFTEILVIASAMGLLKVGSVSLDGTKIEANASKHKAYSYKYAKKLKEQLRSEVEKLLEMAESAEQSPLPDGLSLPDELALREERLAKLDEVLVEIERRAAERYAAEQTEYEGKLAEREKKAKDTGRRPGGRPPTAPKPGPTDKDQVNMTDPESGIMLNSNKGFSQAYNSQASVEHESRMIVGQHVSRKANDKKELEPALEELKKIPRSVGEVEQMNADNGYWSPGNAAACEEERIEAFIATGREPHHPGLKERFEEPPELSPEADSLAKMRHKLKTRAGKAIYALRKQVVEPVFGIIKSVLGFRRFSLRGLKKVQGEWCLICLAYNLKRMHIMVQNA